MKSLMKFNLVNAASVDEAVSILKNNPDRTSLLAGGTDLLGTMRFEILPDYPDTVINLKTIPGLDYIREEDGMIKIGALTRLQDIAVNPVLREHYTALAEAARRAASPHVREMGTIAGNMCQLNRCWYFRKEENRFDCMRKGGQTCFAIVGENRYHSIFGGTKVADSPCTSGCPGNVNIPSYLEKIRDNDLPGAARILLQNNPFPAITGRVCPHTCEQACNRREFDEAVSVRSIERFMGDYILENQSKILGMPEKETGKKIGIVGSGPAGLSAAFYLRKSGHRLTIFDRMPNPGGMLFYDIPAYRLPDEIIKKQIKVLENMGVEIQLGVDVGKNISLEDLQNKFDSLFLACGVQKQSTLEIERKELLLSGLDFLSKARLGKAEVSPRVLVIGGGNVAIDVATVASRLGADEVYVASLESREEMPAFKSEVEAAVAEGINLLPSWGPYRIFEVNGKVTGMELVRCTSVYNDECVFSPAFDDNDKKTVEVDQIILAIGQKSDLSFIDPEFSVNIERGLILVDPETLATSMPGVFAGGDITTGSASVIKAIAAGRKAADSIDWYLNSPDKKPKKQNSKPDDITLKFDTSCLRNSTRVKNPEIPMSTRISNLDVEDVGSLDHNAALEEAKRCFNCGCYAVNPSDLAPALIVLDAKIITSKRTIDAGDFWAANKGIRSTVLDNDEIVTEIQLPKLASGVKTSFKKFALRKSIDFPVVNCAAAIGNNTARICLNAVFNKPYRVVNAEKAITSKVIDEVNAEAAGAAAVSDAVSLNYNEYKIQIAKAMVTRTILACK
jgi:NADPH-dependent glutamate synthase beta subunit-like oxidoreductase/CO/xanthine dehydrogenase FAD-binding subunit